MSLAQNRQLYKAAMDGDHATCEELIRKGARIDAHDKNGCTPLYMASMYGHHEIVSLLLMAQAPPDRANKLGWTPLITAANNGRVKCVKMLLDAGADPQKRNSDGKSAFDKVRERRKSEMSPERVECFNLLRGARPPSRLAQTAQNPRSCAPPPFHSSPLHETQAARVKRVSFLTGPQPTSADALLRSGATSSIGSIGSRSSLSDTPPSRNTGASSSSQGGNGMKKSSSQKSLTRPASSASLGSLFDVNPNGEEPGSPDSPTYLEPFGLLNRIVEGPSRKNSTSSGTPSGAQTQNVSLASAVHAAEAFLPPEEFASSPLTREQLLLHDSRPGPFDKPAKRFPPTAGSSSSSLPDVDAREQQRRSRSGSLLEVLEQAASWARQAVPDLVPDRRSETENESLERDRAEAKRKWEAEEAKRKEERREAALRRAALEAAARRAAEDYEEEEDDEAVPTAAAVTPPQPAPEAEEEEGPLPTETASAPLPEVATPSAATAAAPRAARPNQTRLEGRLKKQSEWLGAWNARYFRLLPGGTLVYFHGEPNGKMPDALMPLAGSVVTVAADEPSKPGIFGFQLKTKARTLQLRAETDDERRQWVAALTAAAA